MRFLIFQSLLVMNSVAFAAACCGGSSAVPSLITGDDKSQFSTSYSQSQTTDQVLSSGVWTKRRGHSTQTLKMDSAILFSDLWQGGLSFQMIEKSVQDSGLQERKSSFGDINLTLGYESLPEWDYSLYSPKGYTFLTLTLPTGKSINESTTTLGTDISGRGVYSIGLGQLMMKAYGAWDYQIMGEIHQSISRTVYSPTLERDVTLKPGRGYTIMAGMGWNKKELRIGGSLSHLIEDPMKTSEAGSSGESQQFVTTASLAGGYRISSEMSSTLTLSSQKIFGNPQNTDLNDSITLSLQKRWPR